MAEDKVTNLYNAFVKSGYAMEPEAQFRENLKDPKKRKAAYDALVADGYNMEPFADFESNIGFGAPKPAPTAPAPQQQAQPAATAAPASTTAQTSEPAQQERWQPTEQEKIRMMHGISSSVNDFNQKSNEQMNKTRRMTERSTPQGRKKLKAAEFRARVAGVPTKMMGLTPDVSTASPDSEPGASVGASAPKPPKGGQSPVPYGVKVVDGKKVTEWLLPDGSLTTDISEADMAEYGARTARLRHQFETRMKQNGLDPAKKEDVTRQSILDRMEENHRRQGGKSVEMAKNAAGDFEWREDESFFDNLGRLARNSIMRSENAGFGSSVSEEADEDMHNLKAENYLLSKALTRLDANKLRKSEGILYGALDAGNNLKNLGAGFADALSDENLYLGGMVDFNMAKQLMAIDGKVRRGTALSETDRNLVYAALLNIEAEQSGSLPHMYSAAVTTAEMAPFMIEMMANPASGLSQSMVRQFGRSAISRFGKKAIRKNVKKYVAGKAAMTLAGDLAQSAVLVNTVQAPKTISDAMQRFIGDPVVDSSGRVTGFDGDHNALEAFAKAQGAAIIENYTELLGNHFGSIASYLGKGVTKVAGKVGLGRMVENTSELIGRIKGTDWAKAVGEIEKRAQWNGTLGEIMEEEAGIVLNSLFVGDNSLSDLTDIDTQIDIALGVGLFGGFVSGIKTGGYVAGRRKAKANLRDTERVGAFRYGDDWETIRYAIDNAEDSDVSSIVKGIISEAESPMQAEAVVRYAQALMKARGYNLAAAKKNAELSETSESAPEQAVVIEAEIQSENAYDSGQEAYGRFEEGDETAQAEIDAITLRMQEAYQLCEDAFGAEAEYYMYHVNENPWALVNDPELTAEQQDAVLYYINSKAALDGVMDASNEAADSKREQVRREVAGRTHRERDVIIPAVLKVDDKPVYIVKGDVVIFPDGSAVDVRNSSESIVIMDESGEYKFISPDQIHKVGESIDPQEELQAAYSQIDAEQEAVFGVDAQAEAEAPDEAASASEPVAEVEAPELPVGNVEEYDKGYEQGIASTDYTDEELSNAIEASRSYLNEGNLDDFGRGRLEGLEYEQQRRQMEAQNAPAEATGNNGAENIPAPGPQAETALSRIPFNEEKQDYEYTSVEPETAWDGLVEAMEGEANALPIAQQMLEDANKKLEALDKKPPTPAKPKLAGKAGPMAMRAEQKRVDEANAKAQADYEQALADAQAEAQAWNDIIGVYSSRNAEQRRQQEEERRQRDAEAHNAAVAQFEAQQRIKAEKQAEAERLGTHNVHPRIRERWEAAPKIEGNTDVLTLSDGSSIAGRYVLTEAGAATPSHDVNNAYAPTEGFPVDENGQSVNDRDYLRDKDAQRKVEEMAGNYDNRALQDAVIVSKDGVVLSGNNRTMSGDLAARQGTDRAYNDYLAQFGHKKFGFSPEQVQSMKNPRVLFVPEETLPYDAATFARFNAQEKKSQSKPEAAVKLGKIVPNDVFADIVNDISRYDRLSDYYADEKAVAHALGALMQAGVVNGMQMPELRTGTAVSAAGKELIENTLIGKVFQATPDAVRQIISMPTLRQSIVMGLNEIANNSTLARGYDISGELSAAVDLVARAKAAMPDVYTDGMPVSPFGRMQGLFDDEFGDSRVTDATALLLADILNSGKPGDLRKIIAAYNHEASLAAGGQADIFKGDIASKEDILTEVNKIFRNAAPKEQQALVDAAIAERKRRAEAEAEHSGRIHAGEQTPNTPQRSEEGARAGESSGDAAGDGRRSGNMEQAEEVSYELSEEVNEFGKPFVKSSDGTIDFGFVDEASGLSPLPIRLSLGENYKDESGDNHGYGYLHIDAGHRNEILQNGFSSVEEFVESVAKNYTDIKEGALIGKNQTYLLEVSDEHNNTLFIQLSRDGMYWNVNSAGIFKKRYSRRKPKVYSRPAVGSGKDTDTTEVNSGHIKGATAPAGNSSETSDGKVTNSVSDKQADGAESFVNQEPTEAQKAAGNYKMEHRRVDGYNISIENSKGSVRRGRGEDGTPWETTMQNDYGYIRGTQGPDGDHIDVFLSDAPEQGDVFVVDQVNADGSFDEHKVMYGFPSVEAAREAYLSNYEPGWTGLGAITHVSKEEFKKWIQSSKRKTKPFADYKSVKPILYDKQGNPIEENGNLIIEDVKSIVDITDADFTEPTRTVGLPALPEIVQQVLSTNGKRVIIKKNIFERNALRHDELTPDMSRAILNEALYNPTLYGKNKPLSRPNNWIVINVPDGKGNNKLVVLEVNESKDNVEIVHWHEADKRGLEKIKRQAEREDGQLLILPSETSEEAGALSGPTFDSPSDGKVNTLSADKQTDSAGSSLQDKAAQPITEPYTITPAVYVGKSRGGNPGKETLMHRVTFNRPLSAEQEHAVKAFANEAIGEKRGRYATKRGWLDREAADGSWLFRTEEDARKAGEMIGNEEAVADAQPLSREDIRQAGASADKPARKKPAPKPANTATLEDLADKQEESAAHVEKPAPKGQFKVTDEMRAQEDELRRLLGIDDDEGSRDTYFRDPDDLTSAQKRKVFALGVDYAFNFLDNGVTAFPDFAKAVVGRLGAKVKPFVKSWYEGAKRVPGYGGEGYTDTAEVDRFDIENFDKPSPDAIRDAEMRVAERKARKAAEQAEKELIAERNEQRKKDEQQTATDTAALAEKAEAVAGEAESIAETSADAGELNRASELIDQTLEEVNSQLALLGYYEADLDSPEHEVYGLRRSAEKKAVKDAVKLAKQLVDDLGIEIDKVAGKTTEQMQKSRGKNDTAVRANIAQVGGDIAVNLPYPDGRNLHINIGLSPTHERGVEPNRGGGVWEGDNYEVDHIMFRFGDSHNHFLPADVTYGKMLDEIQRVSKWGQPKKQEAPKAEQQEEAYHGTVTLKDGREAVVIVANHTETMGESARLTNYIVGVKGEPGTIKISPEEIAHAGAPTAEEISAYAKDKVSHNGYKVGDDVMWDRYGNGKWEKVKIEDFDTDGSPIFEAVKGVMSEKGDWSRVKPADGIFGEARRVARAAQEKKKSAPAKKKTAIKPEQPVADLFGGLFDEPINDEKKTDVQPRPGTAERERGHEPQSNESLGESQRNEVKGTDGRGMGGRDSVNPMSDGERGAGVSRKPESRQPLERLPESDRKNIRNNRAERGTDYAPKGEDARIKANIEAIELAKRLLDAGETATPEQMAVLRRFSGWGGLGKAFNDNGYNPTSKRLRELLGEEGYKDAVMSRNSAYFTPAPVIDAMWDVARALGFKGGNVLEGSAGIGNILGLMPADLSDRSNIQAVEVDSTTGGILSLLYPDANVDIQGFEKTKIRNNSVDLAITNVPFITGQKVFDETGDKDLSKKFRDIHDFCIAKNIRKLREGGIGIFITSSGTMDNSKELRRWICNEGNADVVGAFRMNNKTFGGTGATSDIIVVRKRVNGKPSPNAIDVAEVTGVRVADYDTGETRKVKGQNIPVVKRLTMDYNSYFAEHPENMAGEMRFGFEEGDTFRPTGKSLYPVRGKEQSEMLNAWAGRFSDMEEETAVIPNVEDEVTRINEQLGEGVKEGSMLLNSEGQLCIARMGEAIPIMSPQADKGKPQRTDEERLSLFKGKKVKGHTKAECFKAYTAIKKALSDVLQYQSSHEGDEGLAPLLKELNHAFDTFTRTYGNLHKNPAISFLRNDVDFSSILALETYSEKGDKKGNKVVKVGKTDIFRRRVIDTEKEPHPTTIKDGILASLYKSGGIDVEYIGRALGKSTEDVKREIVESGLGFENPSTGAMEVSYKYLSGNVREKLHIAQENNESGRYDANIKALENAIPMTIPAHLIEFTLGSSWIEPKLYEDFIYENTGVRVTLTNVGGTWFMKTPWSTYNEKNRAMAVVSKMCDKVIMGHELIESAITNKQITISMTVKHPDRKTETITDKTATAECSTRIDEIRAKFKDWARERMQADPEMSARMERTYNYQFNNYVPMSIPDEFVPQRFGGQVSELHGNAFALRPHQARAVVRGTTEPILLAHEVGTGKTYTLITTAMEMRRLGTARKPMIVVQNATVGQFVESAKEIYPNAKVLTIEEADRTAEGRRNFYAKIKYNDWDMIVVPQSVFERIPDSPEREMAYVKDIIDEKMKVLEAMREADTDGKSMIVRQAERELAEQEERLAELTEAMQGGKKKRDEKKEATTRQNAEVRALEMLDREVDDVENFDDMGIDALLVDETHEYKHLGFATAMQRGVKGVDPSFSKKSQGVFLKAQAVMERNNGRNVVFATGTPISNTAAEIWTFMRYLMPADTMKAYGIYYFDDFVRNFGNIAQMVEFGTNGKFKENNRFAGYVNLPELVRIWSSVADTVLTREAGGVSDKIPDMEGGKPLDIFLPQTRALRSVMKYVKSELERYDKMTGKQKKENSHIPLTMYGIAKAAAVDVRLVVPDAEDDPNSKTNATVRETLRSLKDSAKYKGTVAIFSDNYQNKESGFNLYEDIRKKLIAEGVPADQIVVIKSGMTVKKKLDIFDKVNAGEIRVVLGSTFTLGTGVNIQERLHTLIHVDAPNRPMDYTQRNGRALRQGNLHKDMGIPVRIIRFGVEDSLDVTAYQRLKTKGAIADSIMNGAKLMQNSMENRVLEEEEDFFGDMTAQLSGSEYAILKNQAEREVRNLTAKQNGHDIDQIYIHNQLPKVEGFIKGAQRRIEIETKNLEIIGRHFPDGSVKKIIVGRLSFDSISAMEDFFKEQNAKMNEAAEAIREGADNYSSKLTVDVDGLQFEVTTTVNREIASNGQGSLSFEPERSVTYSCEALGIKDKSVKGNRLKNVMQKIAEEIATGKGSRERLARGEQQLAHYSEEYRHLQERNGKESPFKAKLAEAKERLAKYEEAMRKELEEKEAKYAELDKSVEAASDVTFTEEESEETAEADTRFRDGEEMSDGERFRAIRALEPIEIERNDMSRAELREVYNNLPAVEKDGREIEFYHSAFKKVYREGGIFGQVVPLLNEVLEHSVLAYSEADSLDGVVRADGTVHKEHTNVTGFDNYVGKVRIDGADYYARMTVQNGYDGISGMHSCFVTDVELYEKTTIGDSSPGYPRATTDGGVKSATGGTDSAILRRPNAFYDGIVDAKLQQFFERASSEANELDKTDRIRELSEKLNTPVRIVSDRTDIDNLPSARHRRAKGFYDAATDDVVIIVPNNTDVADVDNTFVHEVVGHKGLRAFIGEERFDEFLGEVYNHASNPIRKVIDKKTDGMVNAEADCLRLRKAQARERAGEDVNSSYYADMAEARVEAEAKREAFRREATEEYMSDLGGRIGSEGFEKMSRDELTLWGKIKAKVQSFLDKFLRGLKIAKSIRLSDKDLSYILYKSWKNLRDKQGKGGVFAEAEDAVMRMRTGWDEPKLRPMTNAEKEEARAEVAADNIEELFDKAVTGNLTGKPVEVGRLTAEGKAFLERLSGIKLKDEVSFVLNPSDLMHMYRDHFGNNEKDRGNNIPLSKSDIRAIPEVISCPERVIFGLEPDGLQRKMFYFLSPADTGTYNLLEVYSDRKGNLTAKTFYKTRKTVSQRVLSLMKSEHLTSVTDGASLSYGAKLPKFFEYPKSDEEETFRFRDGDIGLDEYITKMKAEAMQANADNLQAKRDAMRAIGGNLNHLRQAMARQREYDITTVKSVADLARILLDANLLDDLSKYETKRILGAINNVVGKQDVSRYVQKVMDIMVDNQLRMGANTLGRLLSIRGSRVDARGIEVQGELDPDGQRIAQVMRKSTSLPKDDIDNRIAEAINRMSSTDQAIADEATLEYAGLQIARQYVEDITESKAEEKALRDSIKQTKEDKDAGQMTEDAYKQYVESTNDAIRQNKIERAEAYQSLIEQMGDTLSASVERAKAWREAEKQRVEEIHHNANSDMEGRPTDEHHKDDRVQKFANNSAVRFLLAPLGTFDQMLRMFGKKNVNGEGYLWNRYMRGWVSATEKEYTGYRDALKVLDAKVREIYGKDMKWGDLFSIDRKLPKASIRFFDGGEMKDHELTQGNLLYIYMADKMSDGRMKLRRMGITEDDIENIKNFLDPKFIQLADWMQEEFLVDKRNEYNEVHKRMFGASMAAIENYFPLKILANARLENVDVADDTTDTALPATSTGSIIKRRRNNLALDVTGANAFSVILDHLQQMERWAAFAEFNRDLNTLLSYKRFRNQVMNMSSVYGGGKTLWKNFRNVCSMAAGAYRPPIADLDKAAVNIAKGVTAAKVSFRVFTALKQFLSMPAYISDSNPFYLAANIANPIGAWKWSMENLPLFEKRWRSRMAGDPRLLKSDMDWKMWRSRVVEIASRVGMSPNAFVDALTVAIGTHAMYQSRLANYKRKGYDPDIAEERAKQDATILFNQTQQSNEGAFLSTMQVDRSWLSVLFTVFRNSSMSYTRQLYDSLRNLKRCMTPGNKALSVEFMAKQMWRDGIDPDKATANAKREYRRNIIRDLARVAVFGFALQFAWNLGAYLPYLILGEDDEEKDKMWQDVWNHSMFGSIEGLTGGDVISAAGNMWVSGEGNPQYLTKDMPLASDVLSILKKMDKDQVSAINDVVNLLVQSTVGVNPQSLTDAVVAVMDYCGDDAKTSRECALLIARVLNCPQSQLDKIYFDELDASGEEASQMTPSEIAERYARYKVRRGAPLTGWAYGSEEREKLMDKYRDRSNTLAKERLTRETDKQASQNMAQWLEEFEATKDRVKEIRKVKSRDEDRYYDLLDELEVTPEFDRYLIIKDYKRDVDALTKEWLRATTPEQRDSCTQAIINLKRMMVTDLRNTQQ